MAQITVHRPDVADDRARLTPLARRVALTPGAVVTIIENGKPNARALLAKVADGLRARLPIVRVDIHSKPSAALAITADEAKAIAARSHLVITGVGD